MADVIIMITIPEAIYMALDAARKSYLITEETVRPDGSREIIQTPKFPSVEAQIHDEFRQRFMPYAAALNQNDPQVKALEDQIAGLQGQLEAKRDPGVVVTRDGADVVVPTKRIAAAAEKSLTTTKKRTATKK